MPEPAARLQRELQRLRELHVRPERDRSIGRSISAIADDAARTHRRLGAFIDLWESLVPAELAAHSRVVGLRGGVAQVVVESASVAYELDRMLREGLEGELRRRYPSTLIKVKLSVGERHSSPTPTARTTRA